MAATLTLRSVKGSPLTNNEVDANFSDLNTAISSNDSSISTINGNINTINNDISTIEGNITTLQGNVSTINSDITTIQNDITTLESAVGASNLEETVADVVGGMVSSNTESGISVTYDDTDNTLDFNVDDFTLTIAGDATGSATVTNLSNTTLTLDISSITGNLSVTGDVDAANFNSTSDLALKKNLYPIEDAISKVELLTGYKFNWRSNESEGIGIVAQEVEKVFPQMVTTGSDGIRRVSYDSLIPVLIQAVKELNFKIDQKE